MPSTFSPRLRFELVADGEQLGVWGQTTNRNLGKLIEDALAGYKSIALPNANYTLTAINGMEDESRFLMLEFTGTLTAPRVVTVPAVAKTYLIRNSTNQTLTVTPSGGTGAVVPAGRTRSLMSTGTVMQDSLSFADSLNLNSSTIQNAVLVTATINGGTATFATATINGGVITGTAVRNLPTPTLAGDAARKDYVDAIVNLVQADADAAAASAAAAASSAASAAFSAASALNSANAAELSSIIAQGAANYQGDYNPAVTYALGQSVTFMGEFYYSKVNNNLGNTPVDGPFWAEANLAIGLLPIGIQAYLSKNAVVPENHIVFTEPLFLDPAMFVELGAVVPPGPDQFRRPDNRFTGFLPSTESFGFDGEVSVTDTHLAIGDRRAGAMLGDGAVYIYSYTGGVWVLQQTIENPVPGSNSGFGASVSLSGNRLIVGAPFFSNSSGEAYVYLFSGGVWVLEDTLVTPTTVAFSEFGRLVRLDGDYAIVGAPNAQEPSGGSGAAYIYLRSGANWTLQQSFFPPNPNVTSFGSAVAISDGYAVIHYRDLSLQLAVNLVFLRTGTVWSQTQELTRNASEDFGDPMDLKGAYLILSDTAGYAEVYFRGTTTFDFQASLQVPFETFRQPLAVSITSKYAVMVFAEGVYVWERFGSTWVLEPAVPARRNTEYSLGGVFGEKLVAVGVVFGPSFSAQPFFDSYVKTANQFIVLDPLPLLSDVFPQLTPEQNTIVRVA